MNIRIYTEFEKILRKVIELHSINSIMIAISGGQDSLCLVKLLNEFKKKLNFCHILIMYI